MAVPTTPRRLATTQAPAPEGRAHLPDLRHGNADLLLHHLEELLVPGVEDKGTR